MQAVSVSRAGSERVPLAAHYRSSGFQRRWRNCSDAAELFAGLAGDAIGLDAGERGLLDCAINELLELAWQQGAANGDLSVALQRQAGLASVVLTLDLNPGRGPSWSNLLARLRSGESAQELFERAVSGGAPNVDSAVFGLLWLLADLGFTLGSESVVQGERLLLQLVLPQ